MKIAIFLSDFPLYFLPWACNIIEQMANKGFQIDVFVQNSGSNFPVFPKTVSIINLSDHSVNLSPLLLKPVETSIPFANLFPDRVIGMTHNMAKERGYDYCLGLEKFGLLLAKIAADISSCPLGYMSFELYEPGYPGVYGDRILEILRHEAKLIPQIDLFMIQDHVREYEYFRILQSNERPHHIMYFPISLSKCVFKEKPKYWHKKFDLSDDTKIIFYTGQIGATRFLDRFIESAQSFKHEQKLLIQGTTFGNTNLIHTLKGYDRNNKVLFSINEVDWKERSVLVASADIGLIYYRDKPINDYLTGRSSDKMAAYMQAGIPIICPNYPTFINVVDRFHNGKYISAFSELPDAVNNIIDNSSFYSDGAKDAFEKLYDADIYIDYLVEHIRRKANITENQLIISTDIKSNNFFRSEEKHLKWEDIVNLSNLRLYAGDIPNMKEYEGWIGLSLTKSDARHILHDVTKPFPLPDNSVYSFQAEDVFEHIPYEQLVAVINEIFRILKPNGLFRLSLPDYGCDVLQNRAIKDNDGNIVFDPGGGGSFLHPGHLWFPRINTVRSLVENTDFAKHPKIHYLHYYKMDNTFVMKPIDYAKGHVQRTPDFDTRVQEPYRPMSMVVDLVKNKDSVSPDTNASKVNYINSNQKSSTDTASDHYNAAYFEWQKNIGAFGGIANIFKFKEFIHPTDTVIDFGCGGGYLLENINCQNKIGIEINDTAREEALKRGIKAVATTEEIQDNTADVIISNHALEHVVSPVEVLQSLYKILKVNGTIIFVVPHQDTMEGYDPNDINKHLYSWNQLTFGNLFAKAGFKIVKVEAIQHQWPPNYIEIYSTYGEEEFHKICRDYAIKNNNYQIRIISTKQ